MSSARRKCAVHVICTHISEQGGYHIHLHSLVEFEHGWNWTSSLYMRFSFHIVRTKQPANTTRTQQKAYAHNASHNYISALRTVRKWAIPSNSFRSDRLWCSAQVRSERQPHNYTNDNRNSNARPPQLWDTEVVFRSLACACVHIIISRVICRWHRVRYAYECTRNVFTVRLHLKQWWQTLCEHKIDVGFIQTLCAWCRSSVFVCIVAGQFVAVPLRVSIVVDIKCAIIVGHMHLVHFPSKPGECRTLRTTAFCRIFIVSGHTGFGTDRNRPLPPHSECDMKSVHIVCIEWLVGWVVFVRECGGWAINKMGHKCV